MILHDSFFFNINQSINKTHVHSTVVSHSPIFHSFWTLTICSIGCFTNFSCLLKIVQILIEKNSSRFQHLRSINKNHSLLILTFSSLILSILCLISSFDERFFHQSLIARFHLCSIFIFLLKFILHFCPLSIIFILLRYHYFCRRRFRFKRFQLTASSQLLCTNLSWIIPFLLAFAWSIDAFWLWGEMNMNDFSLSKLIEGENQYEIYEKSNNASFSLSSLKQQSICYLQINHNVNFTSRLLSLVEIDYLLLFLLYLFGKTINVENGFFSDKILSV